MAKAQLIQRVYRIDREARDQVADILSIQDAVHHFWCNEEGREYSEELGAALSAIWNRIDWKHNPYPCKPSVTLRQLDIVNRLIRANW